MKYRAETLDLLQNVAACSYLPLNRCRIDFTSHIDIRILQESVMLSRRTLPLIGCGFEMGFFRSKWVELGFSEDDYLRILPAGNDAEAVIAACFTEPMDLAREPHLRIDVVRSAQRDTLCIRISHLLCDGSGLKEYVALLSSLYTAIAAGMPLPEQCSYTRSVAPLLSRLSFLEKLRIPFPKQKENAYSASIKREQLVLPPDKSTGPKAVHLLRKQIAGQQWNRLRKYARENGHTINDLLIAAFARSLSRALCVETIPLPTPFDLRPWIAPGTPFGISNFGGSYMCHIRVRKGDNLADTVAQAALQMQRLKTDKYAAMPVLSTGFYAAILPHALLHRFLLWCMPSHDFSLSNTGILAESMIDFAGLPVESAYMLAQFFTGGGLHVVASTWQECCTLTCNFISSPERRAWNEQVVDAMVDELSSV
ncbi:MAG: condensation domain-containing protein [Clostridiales Family XIII bacterium]|jgi:NRPS condensation-like uncharacterized protein|nr:condensation domain-containing protein [Clostridiales Family XIII bacterium]